MFVSNEDLKRYNKLYPTSKIIKEDLLRFSDALRDYFEKNDPNESEENLKSRIRDLLKNTVYKNLSYEHKLNENNIDYAIKSEKDKIVKIIIEVKRKGNNNEMIFKNNLNKKAFQEALDYYFKERLNGNTDIKHLAVTNGEEWFLFDEKEIQSFHRDHRKSYENIKDSKSDVRQSEIGEWLKSSIGDFNPIHFSLDSDFKNSLDSDIETNNNLINLYKILHPDFLLKEFAVKDANELNEEFYHELLHIMGLKENEKTTLISIDETNVGSLSHCIVSTLVNDKGYERGGEKLKEDTMELLITWINRILFLKLFEAQLISFNQDKHYGFLNEEKIPDYSELKNYFFEVFGKSNDGENHTLRKGRFAEEDFFRKLPYLNSSLFEITQLEMDAIHISNLDSRTNMTRLKEKTPVNTLHYLFEFLDRYDFSNESNKEKVVEKKETVVNAAVLGLIFEKLNGYKEGSFYTPGFITSYIARETIEKAVVEKFNQSKLTDGAVGSLDDIGSYLGRNPNKEIDVANLIDSMRICDPAVGSGHFLVSALNVLLAVKARFGLIRKSDGSGFIRRDEVSIEIENDVLVVYRYGEFYQYKRGDVQGIQEAIFHEKKTLIENCLFGVDINPNSADICRLRLWIELLKHTHYLTTNKNDHKMAILPNIDINIKSGNSLVSKFKVEVGQAIMIDKNLRMEWVKKYRDAVNRYKNTSGKADKKEVTTLIRNIKEGFRQNKDPSLFGMDETHAAREKEADEGLYKRSMEWMLEFPEVLDDEGRFLGFDVVIGNPPYIRQEEIKEFKKNFGKTYFLASNTSDLYIYFYELAYKLMKERAFFGFITSNKWMRTAYGKLLREFIVEKVSLNNLIDLGGFKVFKKATVDTNIITYQKAKPDENHEFKVRDGEAGTDIRTRGMKQKDLSKDGFVLEKEEALALKAKIEKAGKALKDWDVTINRGVLTGYNEAFIIDTQTKDALVAKDPKNAQIIKPILRGRDIQRYGHKWAGLWLIFTRRGIDIEKYPVIKEYLNQYYNELRPRNNGEKTGRKPGPYEWYEIQDNIAYYQDFEKEKVVWQEMIQKPQFYFDINRLYLNDTTFIMTGSHLKYVLAILNAKASAYFFKTFYAGGGLGEDGYRYKKAYLENLPIPVPTPEQEKEVVALVDKMLAHPDDKETDEQINQLVYTLYGLTEEEIKIVEGGK